MALELPALPFALVESNIFEEVAARAQTEQDVQRSRMLDPEYLVLLGQSVLARHSVHLAVAQGLHPGYIMVSIRLQCSIFVSDRTQHDVADQLVESRLARLGRAYFFREDAMVVDVGYNDQVRIRVSLPPQSTYVHFPDLRRRYLHVLGLTRRRRSGRRLLPQLAIRCSRLGDIPVR